MHTSMYQYARVLFNTGTRLFLIHARLNTAKYNLSPSLSLSLFLSLSLSFSLSLSPLSPFIFIIIISLNI